MGKTQAQAAAKSPGSPRPFEARNRRDAFEAETERLGQFFRSDLYSEKPRQLLSLVLGVAMLLLLSRLNADWQAKPEDRLQQNVRMGLAASLLVFLVVCFLQLPDGWLQTSQENGRRRRREEMKKNKKKGGDEEDQ